MYSKEQIDGASVDELQVMLEQVQFDIEGYRSDHTKCKNRVDEWCAAIDREIERMEFYYKQAMNLIDEAEYIIDVKDKRMGEKNG